MKKHIQYVYLPLCFLILCFSLLGALGFFENLSAQEKVIETFEAGPVKVPKKETYKVKTHFEWTVENPCPCNGENPPCVKTFLNKDLPSVEPKQLQEYDNLNDNSDRNQGGSYVPTVIKESSVRIIVVPFCRQAENSE